jgi:hypothetical protein
MQAGHMNFSKSIATRFFAIFLPIVLIVALGALFLYQIEAKTNEEIIKARESFSIEKLQEVIRSDFHTIVSDLMFLTTQVGIHTFSVNNRLSASEELAVEFREFAKYKGIYDQVRLLDRRGMEIVRVNYNGGHPAIVPTAQLQHKGKRYYFIDTMQLDKQAIFVSPFDLNIEKGQVEMPFKPMIRFGTPLFSSNGDKNGAIILNFLGAELINKLKRISNQSAGQIMLLNRDGYWLVAPDKKDEWSFMFKDRPERNFRHRYPDLWAYMAPRNHGQRMNENGVFTFSSIFPLEEGLRSSSGAPEAFLESSRTLSAKEYYWKLVSHVSPKLVDAEMDIFTMRLVATSMFLLVMIGIGTWTVAKAQVKRDQVLMEKERLIHELQDALGEVKTLSGLIPICASCKKIRDDTGYWNQIETYIEARSEAGFSHGICPECAKKLYPDMNLYEP